MSENGLHKIPTMRAALEVIQELHKGKPCKVEGCDCMACVHCDREWPCRTRRLADQGLGDNLARTTKNGENNE